MRYGLLDLIIDGLKWLFADKKERAFMSIPYNCQWCELLGICRDKENNWKCRNGCMILNYERKQKGILPPKCKTCEYLNVCRDKENKWKCRNGCIIINRQKNAFDTKAIENLTSTGGTGAAGDVASMLQEIASLDENDYYVAYVTLDKVMTYNEFLDWCNKTGISPDWCAICEKTDDGYYAEDIIGFNYNASSIEMGYNKEKYPNLNLFDITEDTESAMKTHTTSLLRYMADSKDFCNLFDENTSEEYLTRLADNIDKNGLNIYGFVVTAQKDTIMNICENTPYVYTKPLN